MSVINSQRSERLIAKRYEEKGYVVTINPESSVIPFSLGRYRPDILATKGTENLIIEVKSAGAKVNSDIYFNVDQETQKHPGWKFLLVTVSNSELDDQTSSRLDGIDVARIKDRLETLDRAAEMPELAELVLPQLWTVYMSALRLFALQDGLEVDNYSDLSLLNQAYSTGILSFDDYESAKRLMYIRNQIVHSLDVLKTPWNWKQLREMVDSLLKRLNSNTSEINRS